MLRKEFRFVMPLSINEYQKGVSWAIAQEYVDSEDKEGMRLLKKQPYENDKGKGQFLHAVYHYPSFIPPVITGLMSKFFPDKSLDMLEESWFNFPSTHTEYYSSDFFKDIFKFHVDTMVLPDLGTSENVHKLPEAEWKNVAVELLDIADESLISNGYGAGYNPLTFKSEKLERGQLSPNWLKEYKLHEEKKNPASDQPSCFNYVCAYKLVSCEFKWWGLQKIVQDTLVSQDGPTMLAFHRKLYCCMDEWIDLTLDDIEKMVDEKLCKIT